MRKFCSMNETKYDIIILQDLNVVSFSILFVNVIFIFIFILGNLCWFVLNVFVAQFMPIT
jgi:hypothetical protein